MRSTLKDVAPPKCVRNGIVKPINKTIHMSVAGTLIPIAEAVPTSNKKYLSTTQFYTHKLTSQEFSFIYRGLQGQRMKTDTKGNLFAKWRASYLICHRTRLLHTAIST